MLGFRAEGQERILEMSSVPKKVIVIKAWGQDPWVERAARGMWGMSLILHYGVRAGKDKGKFPEWLSQAEEDMGSWRPSYCPAEVVFASSKAFPLRLGVPGGMLYWASLQYLSELQVLRTFNFIYIYFCLCSPHPFMLEVARLCISFVIWGLTHKWLHLGGLVCPDFLPLGELLRP